MSREKRLGIARISKAGKKFEIIVDVEKAWLLKNSKEKVDLREVVESSHVYYDAGKGLKASAEDLKKIFGTEDLMVVAEKIIREGSIQLTTEQRRELVEAKKRQLIEFITRNAVDPNTGLPHPPKRIEIALDEARFAVDPFKPVEMQVEDAIKALRSVLPLKIARALIGVQIPPQYIGRTYSLLAKSGKIIRSEYKSDGTLVAELEVPAGVVEGIIEKLNSVTGGNCEVRILRMESAR